MLRPSLHGAAAAVGTQPAAVLRCCTVLSHGDGFSHGLAVCPTGAASVCRCSAVAPCYHTVMAFSHGLAVCPTGAAAPAAGAPQHRALLRQPHPRRRPPLLHRFRAGVCVCVCVCARARVQWWVCQCVSVRACVRACACIRACLRACVLVRVAHSMGRRRIGWIGGTRRNDKTNWQ